MASYGDYNQAYNDSDQQYDDTIIYDIKDEDNFKEVLDIFPIVIVDVWAKWCNPCKKIFPKYCELSKYFEQAHVDKKVIFMKDNVDNDNSVHKFMVSVVPTFFIYVNKEPVIVSNFYDLKDLITQYLE